MDNKKETQWRQRFKNYKRSCEMLDEYAHQSVHSELERAGVIHFYKLTIELSLEILKDYLEAQGYEVGSPREAIKRAYQIELIEDGHTWLEVLSKRNLTSQSYDENLAEKMVNEIKESYIPLLKDLYERLDME